MTDFKVGQKVRVREDAKKFGRVDGRVEPGETGIIEEIYNSGYYSLLVKGANDSESFKPSQLELLTKTLDNLEVGDVLTNYGKEYKVLAVIGCVVLLSFSNRFDRANGWYTTKELKDDGFTLVPSEETPDDTIEVTLEEVAKLKGVDVKKIRIKDNE